MRCGGLSRLGDPLLTQAFGIFHWTQRNESTGLPELEQRGAELGHRPQHSWKPVLWLPRQAQVAHGDFFQNKWKLHTLTGEAAVVTRAQQNRAAGQAGGGARPAESRLLGAAHEAARGGQAVAAAADDSFCKQNQMTHRSGQSLRKSQLSGRGVGVAAWQGAWGLGSRGAWLP